MASVRPARPHHRARRLAGLALGLLLTPGAAIAAPPAVFDAHLHYTPQLAEAVPPETAARTLAENRVQAALVMAPDAQTIHALQAAGEVRVVPFLAISQRLGRKMDWMHVEDLAEQVSEILDAGEIDWQGIGELHIQADDRFAPAFAALLELAVERDLTIMIHGDPAVIDHAYALQPEVRILWAHAGSYAYPPLVNDYLERHPRLHMDVSMRNPRINPEGVIDAAWFELFLEHPERFLIGVDTFSAARWREYGRLKGETRAWLKQLPEPVARAIAFGNGERLFPPATRP